MGTRDSKARSPMNYAGRLDHHAIKFGKKVPTGVQTVAFPHRLLIDRYLSKFPS